jgi:exosortase
MATGLASVESKQTEHSFYSLVFWLKFGIIVTLIALLFWDVLPDMAHDWWIEPALSQGMLLPPLALYVAWIHRKQTFGYPAIPDTRGLFLTALASVTFVIGKLASEDFTTRISFVILLCGMIWTFWGIHRLRSLAFPLLLLATMVPLPVVLYNSLAAPLQLFASDMASQIAQAVGVSVFRDGNIIQLASVSLGVEEACSGLNSLSALSVGGLLFGYLLCSRLLSRLAIFVAAIPLAIVVNVLRVAGTAVLADYNQDLAMGFYHLFSGWLVFVVGAGVLYLLARLMQKLEDLK